jgi:hypothetical protein
MITKLNDVTKHDYAFSKNIFYKINGNICKNNTYNQILKEIYLIIDSATKIIKLQRNKMLDFTI